MGAIVWPNNPTQSPRHPVRPQRHATCRDQPQQKEEAEALQTQALFDGLV